MGRWRHQIARASRFTPPALRKRSVHDHDPRRGARPAALRAAELDEQRQAEGGEEDEGYSDRDGGLGLVDVTADPDHEADEHHSDEDADVGVAGGDGEVDAEGEQGRAA